MEFETLLWREENRRIWRKSHRSKSLQRTNKQLYSVATLSPMYKIFDLWSKTLKNHFPKKKERKKKRKQLKFYVFKNVSCITSSLDSLSHSYFERHVHCSPKEFNVNFFSNFPKVQKWFLSGVGFKWARICC